MSMWMPTIEQVLIIHDRLIALTGGAFGIRYIHLIESAIARANAGYGGVEAHPGLLAKAAAICCGLTQNHGFVDGNKRIGITTMLMILRQNGVKLAYSQEELIQLGLSIAQDTMNVPEVEEWLRTHAAE